MYWIALLPSPDDDRLAWGWPALQFTPRVAWVDEALLLEVGASERLFGGRRRLVERLLPADGDQVPRAGGRTALLALARLRLRAAGQPRPTTPDDLPLHTLTAARPHLATLERIGCTTWGALHALPRAGVGRRFGAELLQALDAAYGQLPERYAWLELPERFDLKQELPALATSTDELMATGHRLLRLLQLWLQARHLGVLALELEWTLDLRKLDGKPLPPTERLEVRTAQPTQDLQHLHRLAGEQLARRSLAAPANQLRLRSLETVPWGGLPHSLLPEDHPQGERLHQLVERLSARLGEAQVTVPRPVQDHRPERMQQWVPVRAHLDSPAAEAGDADVVYPPWLLAQPQPLQVRNDQPVWHGPLQLLTRARRLEAAWWDVGGSAALRDYFVARSASAGLLWIYRERLASDQAQARWFLQGIYA